MTRKKISFMVPIFIIMMITIGTITLLEMKNTMAIDALDEDFRNISNYNYSIYDKTMVVNGITYKVIVAEDGVLLIYDNNNRLVASSKKPVSTDVENDNNLKEACISHFGEKDDGSGACNTNFQSDSITEESVLSISDKKNTEISKYNNYASNTYYKGTDLTGYNEALYNEYENTFAEIIREIAIETTVLLDGKINGEYKDNGIINGNGQTEIKLSSGSILSRL